MLTSVQAAQHARLVIIDRYPNPIHEYALAICGACSAGRARARGRSGLPEEADGVLLETLHPYPSQDQAFGAVCDLIADPRGWVTLAGGYGAGKTTMIYAALNELAAVGVYGRYTTAPALLDALRDAIRDENGVAQSAFIARLAEVPVLAVDELDKYKSTEYAEETIFKLFDERYIRRRTHATLIGYNRDRAERVPAFLRSRIGDGRFKLIDMDGVDVRPEMT